MNFTGYENKTLCVAVSGGVDSVVLLHWVKSLTETGGFSLCAVHLEHGIRGEESKADAEFVKALCDSWEIPLFVFEEDCLALSKKRGESLETAARFFRYSVFESLLQQGKADYILLAHHQADEAETVLFRLARGTALAGVSAMKEREGRYLRPLLSWTKEEVVAYAQMHGLSWREDKTNAEACATRNKLRLSVLPLLESAVPGAKKNLANFARTAKEDDDCLYELAQPLVQKESPAFSGDSGYRVLFCEKKPLFTRACLTVLKTLGVRFDYTKETLDGLYALQGLETGAKCLVKGNLQAVKQYGEIAFFRKSERAEPEEIPFQEGRFAVGRYEVSVLKTPTGAEKELAVDGEKIPDGAVFRLKREGDIFQKFGGGTKKLKKYLVDEKIPSAVRAELPVLAVGNEVLAVVTVELSEKLKMTKDSKEILYLSAIGETKDGNS